MLTQLEVKNGHLVTVQTARVEAMDAQEKFVRARDAAFKAGCTGPEVAQAISTAERSHQ